MAEFAVGDAVQSRACVRGRLVVTHFDEGLGNDLHGMLVFDRAGQLHLHYARDIAGACDICDCYAVVPSGGGRVLLLVYPISRSRKLIWQQGHNRCGKRLTQCTVPGRLAPGAARSTSMGRMTTRRLFMLGGEATRTRNASRLLKYLCEA